MSEKATQTNKINRQLQQTPIAIIGMASIFPKSKNLQEYWENIVRKKDCITDVPPSRWNVEDYYDPDPKAPDKVYCKRGGFIPEIDFDPMEFGLPPNILEATDISQLLGLVVAKQTLEDAGYGQSREWNREQTGVILGVALGRQLSWPLGARMHYPTWKKVLKSSGLSDEDTQKIVEKMKLAYVPWEENSFPGMLANVVSGRIANRLNLGGTNCVVDAACASSLGALKMAISELLEYRCDMMLTGGVDTDNSIVAYIAFSKTPAISRNQASRPFDIDSDGMMLGEGIGMILLKRLEDAERDGDKIYAVIKGIGTSSDGKYKSIYAPRPQGQVNALHRAYEDAGFSPLSVSLIEAHGTGTMAGDPAEVEALKEFFSKNSNSRVPSIALGSVKSQIGHTKAAAGAASLIKTALALHHKVLPPTINITKPNPKFGLETSPFYLNTETRPWFQTVEGTPRRAGVSSFGFGGTNYHVVLEEYSNKSESPYRLHKTPQSVLLFAPTPQELQEECKTILTKLQSDAKEQHYRELVNACKSLDIPVTNARVGFVADTVENACKLLQTSVELLEKSLHSESWEHPQGIYYRKTGADSSLKVVALFPGQGSQYLEMGKEITINFPSVQKVYHFMDTLFSKDGLQPLSEVVFPYPTFDTEQRHIQAEILERTEYAQPAIGALSVGLYKILQQAGFKPDLIAGHSFGELTALWAAEVLSDEDYFFLAKARGQAMATPDEPNFDSGGMLAVKGDTSQVEEIIKNFPCITIANLNSEQQVVLAGAKGEIAKVQQILNERGISTYMLHVSAAFHTPLVKHAQKPFAEAIEAVTFKSPKVPVYTNISGKRYPTDSKSTQKILKEHLINSVHFRQEIENIYADGGYFFVEFGPRNVLTNLVKDILGYRPHLAVALNTSRQKDSDRTLREAVVQLRVAGLALKNLDPYQIEYQASQKQKNNILSVPLNSVNYVSEKTRIAFEEALQDGHQVKLPANTPNTNTVEANTTNDLIRQQLQSTYEMSNLENAVVEPAQVFVEPEQLDVEPTMQSIPEKHLDYQRILDSLEYSLEQFNQYQGETLDVHKQYLNNQMEYAKIFFQLMQQQNSLLLNGKSDSQQLATKKIAVESLERGMMQFHNHQSETLRIHEEYLNHQVEYTENFFQLTHQQYNALITGEFAGKFSHQPLISPTKSAADTQNGSNKPTTNKFVNNSKRVTSNGSRNGSSNGSRNGSSHSYKNGSTNGSSNGSKAIQKTSVALLEPETTVARDNNLNNSPVAPLPLPSTPISVSAPDTEVPIPKVNTATLSETLLTVVSEKTGYPTSMLELSMDIEADLGIDSIKRVEILAALQDLYGELPKSNPEEIAQLRTLGQIAEYIQALLSDDVKQVELLPVNEEVVKVEVMIVGAENISPSPVPSAPATVISDIETLSQTLLNIVSEKTGYPASMLELSMDIEADLGIDSIKRVEILAALQDLYGELPKSNPEEIAQLRTLGQIVEYIASFTDSVDSAEKKNLNDEFNDQPLTLELNHNIVRSPVKLKFLPEPDFLNFTLPDKYVCLMTDDGFTTSELARYLIKRGWRIIVLSFPQSLIAQHSDLPKEAARITLADMSEESLKQQLAVIEDTYGSIGAFVHLNPLFPVSQNNGINYLEAEKAIVKHVFLIAKHLKRSLNEAASFGRSCFYTIARLDGAFGLSQKVNFGAISAGLFGLTKTLNLEWEPVFCRAVDLSPDFDIKQSVKHIIAELHDPNCLISEVGYSPEGRTTLICEPSA